VLVSMPMLFSEQLQSVAETLNHCGVEWSYMPTLADQLAGHVRAPLAAPVRPDATVDAARLIGRHPHKLDESSIRETLTGRVVMITGSGGSIGSELARIVGRFEPERLILVERSENALFEIDREIRRMYPQVDCRAVLHDVTNAPRTMGMVASHRPQILFHAAAHKHVPMMEDHPAEAIENNFYGTRSIADAAHAHRVERFVMISTDKAVNPSSVMGASKRLAELYIQYLNTRSDTMFAMVRFGNVLGSACSVVPIWRQQIAAGRPVTVTDPQMTRYFMTIPEAAGLVIQSAACVHRSGSPDERLSTGGATVFLLDMGDPIRIVDLAFRFIRASGLEPQIDVPIEFTGARPGEKLFEELAYDGEDMLPTPHESIRLWRTSPPNASTMRRVIDLFDRLRNGDADGSHPWQHASDEQIITALQQAVPEMARSPRLAAG
jgi:FlaA1/EpsC-like NDP-sugar epimerase